MQPSIPIAESPNQTSRVAVLDLVDLAARGLPQMLDPERQIFCCTFKKTANGLEREGISQRYSTMTLLGLHRFEQAGNTSPVDLSPILDALLQDTTWVTSAGDLGLLLWTFAAIAPRRLPEVFGKLQVADALHRYSDAVHAYTMEVSWFLTGLAQCVSAGYGVAAELERQALVAFELLKANCGPTGIFGHLARHKSLAGRLRGRFGSFADQVYPICALSAFATAFGNDEAKEMAIHTGNAICKLQGPQGEWWWHYDSSSGRVAGKYPVYSVHQHAMGPMALLALRDVTEQDFSRPLLSGLEWIAGHNALNFNMIDRSNSVIWRSFYHTRYRRYSNRILSLAGLHGSSGGLQVKYECRPYELGWLLYALAGYRNSLAMRVDHKNK